MMRRDEIDSAHIVHKGGAYTTPSVIHTNVSLIKYTANPARKTRREWQTMCITTIPISAMANPVSDVRFWFCWLWFWLTLTQWQFFEKYVWWIVSELLMSDAGYFLPNIYFYCEVWLYYILFGKILFHSANISC